jgi:hypothetical protein
LSADDASAVERVAARIVTGPLAFLLAGLIDVSVFTAIAVRGAAAARLAARRGR